MQNEFPGRLSTAGKENDRCLGGMNDFSPHPIRSNTPRMPTSINDYGAASEHAGNA